MPGKGSQSSWPKTYWEQRKIRKRKRFQKTGAGKLYGLYKAARASAKERRTRP